jgi:hypothetical protein
MRRTEVIASACPPACQPGADESDFSCVGPCQILRREPADGTDAHALNHTVRIDRERFSRSAC